LIGLEGCCILYVPAVEFIVSTASTLFALPGLLLTALPGLLLTALPGLLPERLPPALPMVCSSSPTFEAR
jgi:hypothetical protein